MGPRRLVAVPLVALVLAAAACGDDDDSDEGAGSTTTADAGAAAATVEALIRFDAAARQNPEGIAVDESGDVYLTQPFLGKVLRVRDGETTAEEVGSVPVGADDFGTLGIAIDGDDVLVGVQSAASGGIWRFPKAGGDGERIPGTEAIPFANDLFVDDDGTIWVASSVEGADDSGALLGAVWRVADGEVERWLAAPILGGTGEGPLPAPIGANGIAVRDDTVYVSNTQQGHIVSIPIGEDARPGAPEVFAEGAELGGSDGITFDGEGDLYVAVVGQSQIVRIDQDDRSITVVAGDEDGLDYPSAVELGAGAHEGDLLAVNFAIAELVGATTVEGPALLLIDLAD